MDWPQRNLLRERGDNFFPEGGNDTVNIGPHGELQQRVLCDVRCV